MLTVIVKECPGGICKQLVWLLGLRRLDLYWGKLVTCMIFNGVGILKAWSIT